MSVPMISNLDTMTFAPNQQVNAKTLIASNDYLTLMTSAGLADNNKELFSNTKALLDQVSLRTVRSILAASKDPKLIELRSDDHKDFVTILKNELGVSVHHYKRFYDTMIDTQRFQSVSEAILYCVSHGYHSHCSYLAEIDRIRGKRIKLNQRALLLQNSKHH
ncbi:hypothetical protein [Photobacterium damselae]|uniref:hypothetical protein n=1 Tax=Photobacterium damselae TaxID=38293 RepID=UPI004067E1A6